MSKKVQVLVLAGVFTSSTSVLGVNTGIETVQAKVRESSANVVEITESIFKSEVDRGYEFLKETERILEEKREAERLEAERIAREQAELERLRLENEIRKENVGINLDNVLEISNINADELSQVFTLMNKPEMCELSTALVDAEKTYGINALFLASLVANETAYNTSYRAINQNNVSGYAVYNSSVEGTYFNSKYECIMKTAKWLKDEYLSPDGAHFYGYTTRCVNIDYCLTEDSSASDYNWSRIINNIGKTLESYYKKYVK